jgi:hypothetical protein
MIGGILNPQKIVSLTEQFKSVAPETMPAPIVQAVGRMLNFFAGRLPLAQAVRGNASDDPRVEQEFLGMCLYRGQHPL